jgi:hypothetical protein
MTYLQVDFWPGASQANYDAEIAAVHPAGGLPEGQLHHHAAVTGDGVLISAVWDSQASKDSFVDEILMPAQPVAGGFPNPVESRYGDVTYELSA